MPIRGVIFDYGGVIWDMRWEVAVNLARQHGLPDRAVLETLYGNEAWRQLEVGVGDRETWLVGAHAALETLAGREMPSLHQHWSDSQRLIPQNIDLIRRLLPAHKAAVLSNADRALRARLREQEIHDLFDDIVISGEVGVAKPDPRIYELAARRLALPPEQCVFIDDLETNVDAARDSGMHAIHFRIDQSHDLASQLAEVGVVSRGTSGRAPTSHP